MTAQAAIMEADNVSAPAVRKHPGADTERLVSMQRQRTTRPTPEQRFWAKVNKNGPVPEYRPDFDPCWLWTGTCNERGYGQFSVNGKGVRVHRFAYELLVGPIPEGLVIDHLCRVTRCVNPGHLEAVTHAENTLRGFGPAATYARRTHCARGHELTPENLIRDPRYPNIRGACRQCDALMRRRRYDPAHRKERRRRAIERGAKP